jgi:hypothetical protein
MFRAIKDTNTGAVYDWYKINEDGTESHFNVPRGMWKREQDWTQEEIDALFDNVKTKDPEVKPTEEPLEADNLVEETLEDSASEEDSADVVEDDKSFL